MSRLHLKIHAVLLFVILVPLLSGCAFLGRGNVAVAPSCPTQSIAVLDFSMAPRVVEDRDPCTRQLYYTTKPVETEKDIRGWWFGSQDVYYNENMGRIAADLFADAFCKFNVFAVYRRSDLKLYYADKKDVLKKQFPAMTTKQLDDAMLELNPVAIGREIGVDKVVVGRICDSEMRKNRTFGPFASVASYTVSVYNVSTGQLEFTREYSSVKSFASQYSMFEDNAASFASELEAFYQGHGQAR